ncbi:MAG: hypothetical protein OXR72_06210 [Gemmatimonadota bacterium]|nr:hypothetical protein [Gemmatimonadota bacterium]
MRRAIGFTVVFFLAAGTSNAQELGASISGGYSIPGDGRLFFGRCSLNEGSCPFSERERASAQIHFHPMQAGFVLAGDLFLRMEPADIGIGTVMFSKGGISGPSFSTIARRDEFKARDFTRSFRAAFVFLRYRAIGDSPVTPYLGAGVGIHGLRERAPTEFSNWDKGLFLRVLAGGEVRIREGFSSVFTEIRLNFAGLDEDPELSPVAFATFTIAIGLRFAY